MSPLAMVPLAALPWLQGFFAPTAATETPSLEVATELSEWRKPDAECVSTAYGGMSLVADVAPSDGDERILASYTQGLVVLDRDRHLLAHAQGFPCEGSADEVVALAAGDAALGDQSTGPALVALAMTTGGRNENATVLTLYRVSNGGELQPVFIGEVERHVGETTRTGLVTVIPGGLVYSDPTGTMSLWTYDAALGRYVRQLSTRPLA